MFRYLVVIYKYAQKKVKHLCVYLTKKAKFALKDIQNKRRIKL